MEGREERKEEIEEENGSELTGETREKEGQEKNGQEEAPEGDSQKEERLLLAQEDADVKDYRERVEHANEGGLVVEDMLDMRGGMALEGLPGEGGVREGGSSLKGDGLQVETGFDNAGAREEERTDCNDDVDQAQIIEAGSNDEEKECVSGSVDQHSGSSGTYDNALQRSEQVKEGETLPDARADVSSVQLIDFGDDSQSNTVENANAQPLQGLSNSWLGDQFHSASDRIVSGADGDMPDKIDQRVLDVFDELDPNSMTRWRQEGDVDVSNMSFQSALEESDRIEAQALQEAKERSKMMQKRLEEENATLLELEQKMDLIHKRRNELEAKLSQEQQLTQGLEEELEERRKENESLRSLIATSSSENDLIDSRLDDLLTMKKSKLSEVTRQETELADLEHNVKVKLLLESHLRRASLSNIPLDVCV